MQGIDIFFAIAVLVMSVVVHEVSHGYMANFLGDPTARLKGRLTLNPVKHLDPMGSFIVPVGLFLLTGGKMVFGWAKPVPYNPYNLRDQRWGAAKVAAAGPLSNFALAIFFGLILRFGGDSLLSMGAAVSIMQFIVLINLVLGVFNLIPIPPLDGSKVLFSLLSYKNRHIQEFLEKYWLFFFLAFVFFLWDFFFILIQRLFQLITGTYFF